MFFITVNVLYNGRAGVRGVRTLFIEIDVWLNELNLDESPKMMDGLLYWHGSAKE